MGDSVTGDSTIFIPDVSVSDVPVLRAYANAHPENGRARTQLVQLRLRSRLFSPYDAKITSAGFGARENTEHLRLGAARNQTYGAPFFDVFSGKYNIPCIYVCSLTT